MYRCYWQQLSASVFNSGWIDGFTDELNNATAGSTDEFNNSLTQVWCIGEINRWIKQRSLFVTPWHSHDNDDDWRGHSRSLKLVPFESLGAVSYSPSIVTMAVYVAVCEIFSVKEWCELEKGVRVPSRSLELAPFDRSHTSSYSPSIVTMAISCIVCEI